MRGITMIDGELYYERLDGSYAKMPYGNGEAVAKIVVERATPEELIGCLDSFLANAAKRDPARTADLMSRHA
jgi:hypothetical protein